MSSIGVCCIDDESGCGPGDRAIQHEASLKGDVQDILQGAVTSPACVRDVAGQPVGAEDSVDLEPPCRAPSDPPNLSR